MLDTADMSKRVQSVHRTMLGAWQNEVHGIEQWLLSGMWAS